MTPKIDCNNACPKTCNNGSLRTALCNTCQAKIALSFPGAIDCSAECTGRRLNKAQPKRKLLQACENGCNICLAGANTIGLVPMTPKIDCNNACPKTCNNGSLRTALCNTCQAKMALSFPGAIDCSKECAGRRLAPVVPKGRRLLEACENGCNICLAGANTIGLIPMTPKIECDAACPKTCNAKMALSFPGTIDCSKECTRRRLNKAQPKRKLLQACENGCNICLAGANTIGLVPMTPKIDCNNACPK